MYYPKKLSQSHADDLVVTLTTIFVFDNFRKCHLWDFIIKAATISRGEWSDQYGSVLYRY